MDSLSEWAPVIGILTGMIGAIFAGASKLITRWYKLSEHLEQTKKTARAKEFQMLKDTISEHKSTIAQLSMYIDNHARRIAELDKQMLVMSAHMQANNQTNERLGELMLTMMKLMAGKEQVPEGPFRYSDKK